MLHAMRGAGAEIKYKAPRSLSSLPKTAHNGQTMAGIVKSDFAQN